MLHNKFIAILLLVAFDSSLPAQILSSGRLDYAAAPVDNPLKGLVPYQADVRKRFPHSLEFNYLPYSAIVKGYEQFDWQPLEQMLDDIASRGHQTVVRIFLEYPGKKEVIPQFLIEDGLKVHRYINTNTAPLPPTEVETPDYENANLRRSLKNFILAFGKKYDGDARLGFITAGLLGTWGEWHTYPKDELFASKTVQNEVMDAYEAAFKLTPVLLRYPAGEKSDQFKANNAHRNFGYHDDSFAWATLHTGKQDDSWFYMTALKAAGPQAEAKWKTCPIGGEIRPEAWGKVFDSNSKSKKIQNFRQCVDETHVTWLMDSGMFEKQQSEARIANAKSEVGRMGYEFHASSYSVNHTNNTLDVRLEVENRGVAPFYYNWQVEWGILSGNKVLKNFPASVKLRDQLPSEKTQVWSDSLDLSQTSSGKYTIAIRIVNPLKSGQPVRFANRSQDIDVVGWLTICEVELR